MHILVVEDDRKVASFIQKGLSEEGYVVAVAADGEEGSLKASVGEYDVIILDVMLPEYYSLRGWDSEGRPTKKKMDELGLE